MKKTWLVFKYEYLRHVLRLRFLFGLLSLPLFMVFIIGVGIFSALLSIDYRPIGYVDHSGLLAETPLIDEEPETGPFRDPELVAFESEDAARQALLDETIQGFYIIAPDYLETGSVRWVANGSSDDDAFSELRTRLQASLLRDQPEEIVNRIIEGPEVTVRSSDNSRALQQSNILGMMMPIIAGVLFMIAINTSGGYLLQAVVEEKENRTMEIVITSVSPGQLMAGKILGNLSVGLTQLLIWIVFAVGGLLVARAFIPFVASQMIDPTSFWLLMLTILPAFVLVAALMATAGATATEAREAQQVAGLFTLPIFVPYWFIAAIIQNPNGPLATGLSLFPLTAPVTLPLRAAFTNVPFWQAGLTILLLVLAAAGALWFAGRAFRLGMLRYGRRLTWRELFARPSGGQ